MKIYAISDLHLSNACDKPMDVFGGNWTNHTEKIKEKWQTKVAEDDLVLVAGDISWAMNMNEVVPDLEWLAALNGKKIIIRGNHEYWWKSISVVRNALPESIFAIQNDAIKWGKYVICGTRGWVVPDSSKDFSAEDMKIFKREVERLKLTLTAAKNMAEEGDKIICMIHYPPFAADKSGTEFTDLMEQFKVDTVVFGHIHGKTNCPQILSKNGVTYYFTSCDHIDNDPVLLYED